MDTSFFKRCNTCKNEIAFAASYYVCSVSTCHRKGTDFAFCSVECWEAHVPLFRHRDSWAEERRAPSRAAAERDTASAASPPRPSATPDAGAGAPSRPRAEPATPRPAAPVPPSSAAPEELPPLELKDRGQIPEDILVVASKLKAYIRSRSGMNTSDGVLPVLSNILRDLCDDAIQRAHEDGRKTVLNRDLS